MKILVTGCAGFIGFHLSSKLAKKHEVFGIDNLNDYYDKNLKISRLKLLKKLKNFHFNNIDIRNKKKLNNFYKKNDFKYIVHLAAQAGVRYSITHPDSYIDNNINGFLNILECCKSNNIKHLIYASSSSVYGGNKILPFSENHRTDNPISLYAATKKANELMANSYGSLFKIPSTGLRFFTVYGPWGRPDMALFIFTKKIINGKPIEVFNNGKMIRDFTYVDDVVESISRLIKKPPVKEVSRILNVGNSKKVKLESYIKNIEINLGLKAKKIYKGMQDGDVPITHSDTSKIHELIGFKPNTDVKEGVKLFVQWYKKYYEHN